MPTPAEALHVHEKVGEIVAHGQAVQELIAAWREARLAHRTENPELAVNVTPAMRAEWWGKVSDHIVAIKAAASTIP